MFTAPRELWNPLGKVVPGKFHGSGGQSKHNCLHDFCDENKNLLLKICVFYLPNTSGLHCHWHNCPSGTGSNHAGCGWCRPNHDKTKQNKVRAMCMWLYRHTSTYSLEMVPDCSISIANALDILQPCTKSSKSIYLSLYLSIHLHYVHLHVHLHIHIFQRELPGTRYILWRVGFWKYHPITCVYGHKLLQ